MSVVRSVVQSVVQPVVQSVLGTTGPIPIFHMPLQRDFTISKGIGPYTFTAAGLRSYIDQDDGLLKYAGINEGRFEAPGQLIWGAVENLFARSEDASHADWVKTNLTVTANNATAPDGNMAMDLMIPSASNLAHYFRQDESVTSGGDYVTSVFADSGGYDFVQITGSTGFNSEWVNFNLSTGAVGDSSITGGTAKIEDMGGGIYRCSLSLPAISTTTGRMLVAVYNTDISSRLFPFVGDGSSGVNVWGMQFEEGLTPSPYVKTEASPVTALSDNLSVDSDNIPAPGDDYSVSFELDYKTVSPGTVPFIYKVVGETTRRSLTDSSNRVKITHSVDTQSSLALGTTVSKLVGTKDSSTLTLYVDGALDDTAVPGAVTGTKSSIQLGRDGTTSSRYLNGHIKNIKIFDKTLTASEAGKL